MLIYICVDMELPHNILSFFNMFLELASIKHMCIYAKKTVIQIDVFNTNKILNSDKSQRVNTPPPPKKKGMNRKCID